MSQARTRVRTVNVREQKPVAHVKGGRSPGADDSALHGAEDVTRSLGFGERMLRNTAICVALLLCIAAVQSLDTPGAKGFLAEVVSMDLPESLGSLRFVSNLVPESVAVFWNLGGEKHFLPSDAEVLHAFNAREPWIGYGAGDARASAPGEVMSVSIDDVGRTALRIRHAGGMETFYGNLIHAAVREGDWVEAGGIVGTANILTFELRGEGRAMNPVPYFK